MNITEIIMDDTVDYINLRVIIQKYGDSKREKE
jgi:hypothetical protein